MNIFKIFGAVVLGLLAVYFSIGFFVPEVSYENEIIVNKPLEEVFNKFNDTETLDKWIPEISKFEAIDEKPGIVGSKYKMLVTNDGETMEMVETVLAFEENKKIGLYFEAGAMEKTDFYEFESLNGHTRIIGSYKAEGKNIFWKSLFAFFKSYFKEIDQQMLNNFKAFAETGAIAKPAK